MSVTVEELARLALPLTSEARAQLVDLLAASLHEEEPGPSDHRWLADASPRRDDVRSGRVKPIPGEEALRMVRDPLRR